ncbi:MAG: hypothetical protein HOU81_01635 [Hamadaea sp.]|uniref:DUF4760 domain-containing protein n=1 Tax=Hamadaea sp. TaxID=2024425 RepID=UPI0018028AE2|nr:hypothetical protein [Hamadaea sp.]NUR69501.1 hypothetical protein [Hamadaea sp.]NUT20737.1 hypothetical protein [Hamadaea sp.]
MEITALVLSLLSLALSAVVGWRAITLSRQANSVDMVVDLFREHRGSDLAEARRFVYTSYTEFETNHGLSGIPGDGRELIRRLSCYYDNLGALVAHGIVDLDLVAGYMGSSVVSMWDRLEPLIVAERTLRHAQTYDDQRWQRYFENLAILVRHRVPATARADQALWRLDG